MRYAEAGRHQIRDHDRAIQWRFAATATAPAADGPRNVLTLRLVRALAIAVACASMFFVLGLT